MLTLAAKRRAASVIVTEFRRSAARSYQLVGLHRSSYRCRPRPRGDDEAGETFVELAYRHPHRGYLRLGIFHRREVRLIDHEKLFRLYPAGTSDQVGPDSKQ